MSDHCPALLAVVTPARASFMGLSAGLRASRMIEPGAAVPENSGKLICTTCSGP